MEHSCRSEGQDGFSLIEILCAFVIVSFLAATVLQTVQVATRGAASAQERMKMIAVVPKIELALAGTSADISSPLHATTDGMQWEISKVMTSDDAYNENIFKLIIFSEDGKRSYNFVIRRQGKRP